MGIDDLWQTSKIIKLANKEVVNMLILAQHMFIDGISVIVDQRKLKEDIYKRDRDLNAKQIDVRKKILEHLALNPGKDLVASLILIIIVTDIERIGDYAKNLMELSHLYSKPLKGKYIDFIQEGKEKTLKMFEDTIQSYIKCEPDVAKGIMEEQATFATECQEMLEKMIQDGDITVKEGIIYALLIRYLKRVGAHLKNIASSIVNPFHRLGYKPE